VYGTFDVTHARDELAPLASILQGIVLRRDLDQGEAAREAFRRATMAPDTPLGRQLEHVAQAWLVRVQMEAIDKALRKAISMRSPEEYILKDGVHLTAQGNHLVASLVFECLSPEIAGIFEEAQS